jgi:Transposase DDE domain
MRKLQVSLPVADTADARHVVVDSTGIKVYGEGEWKVRQHGVSKRRTWIKLHLGVDEKTGEIVAAVVSTNNLADSQVLPHLLEQVSADGAYDSENCYETIGKHGAKPVIPPCKNAVARSRTRGGHSPRIVRPEAEH